MADWWDDPRRNPLMAAWMSLPPEVRRAYQSGAQTIADATPMAAFRDTVYGAQDVGRGLLNVSPGEIGQGLLTATLGAAGVVPGGRSGKIAKEVTEQVTKEAARQVKPIWQMTRSELDEAAARGQIRTSLGAEVDLADVVAGRKPATDFDIRAGHPLAEAYEAGDLAAQVEKAGGHIIDDRMGQVVIGRTEAEAQRLAAALARTREGKPSIDLGLAYGYSQDDVAHFLKKQGYDPETIARIARDEGL